MSHKDKYIAIQGHECLSSCLAGILNPINHEINSSAIIILGAGMEVTYSTKEDVISSNMYNANYNFLNRYHICYECNTVAIDATYESIDQTFCELLNENVLPIIKLNSASLAYHRVFAQAQNAIHYICLTGYEDDSYYILDNYVPSYIATIFEGRVKKEDIIKAFILGGGRYIVLNNQEAIENISINNDLKEAFKNSTMAYLDTEKKEDIEYGQSAVVNLFHNIVERNLDNTREQLIEYNFQLKIYGFISLKYMLLEVMGSIFNDKNIKEYCEQYDKIINEWNNIAKFMLKCGISKNIINYNKLMDRVLVCVDEESQLLKRVVSL